MIKDKELDTISFQIGDFDPKAIAEKISRRMQLKRISLNLTQKALSSKSGVSLGSVKRFENQHEISLKHLLNIALVLDSLDEFHQLFPINVYQSVDDIVKSNKVKERKRARSV
mgnify:FL=1